ncbi:MAG: DUF4870 domain-containing protein [Verrucomicrobiota bacterium]
MSDFIAPRSGSPVVTSEDDRLWGMLAHLSAFSMYFTGIGHLLGPLIVWLAKKENSPFVADQAKEALNFQISISIYGIVAGLLCFVLIGFPILAALVPFQFVFMIVAGIKAKDGVVYRYPLTLRFL